MPIVLSCEWPPKDFEYRNPENPECPRCWCDDVNLTENLDFWDDEGWWEMECAECHYKWEQVYVVVGLRKTMELANGKEEKE